MHFSKTTLFVVLSAALAAMSVPQGPISTTVVVTSHTETITGAGASSSKSVQSTASITSEVSIASTDSLSSTISGESGLSLYSITSTSSQTSVASHSSVSTSSVAAATNTHSGAQQLGAGGMGMALAAGAAIVAVLA